MAWAETHLLATENSLGLGIVLLLRVVAHVLRDPGGHEDTKAVSSGLTRGGPRLTRPGGVVMREYSDERSEMRDVMRDER